jgi:hypothetical protein
MVATAIQTMIDARTKRLRHPQYQYITSESNHKTITVHRSGINKKTA